MKFGYKKGKKSIIILIKYMTINKSVNNIPNNSHQLATTE